MSAKAQKATEANPFAAISEALESAAERFEEGASNARESAKHAAGSAKKAVSTGLYNGAYGVSYGVVYATVFLTELLPKDNVIRRGLEEGADAAFEAVEGKTEKEPTPAAKPKKAKKSKGK
jgi:hypothetical protein